MTILININNFNKPNNQRYCHKYNQKNLYYQEVIPDIIRLFNKIIIQIRLNKKKSHKNN
jgi:hypothetical protein